MPVLLISLANGQTKFAEEAIFHMWNIDNQFSARLDYSEQFVDKFTVSVNVFKAIDDYHTIKFVVMKWGPETSNLEDVTADQLADGTDALFIQIGAFPSSSFFPEEIADYTVVRSDIQTVELIWLA